MPVVDPREVDAKEMILRSGSNRRMDADGSKGCLKVEPTGYLEVNACGFADEKWFRGQINPK